MTGKKALMVTAAGAFLLVSAFFIAPVWAKEKGATKKQKQAEIRKTANETLNSLYKLEPASRGAIRKAAGYAVFSNFGMKIFFAGGGTGKGVAVHNGTGKETFMKMVEVQAGLAGAVAISKDVWLYQLTDDGLAIELTARGTKYFKDDALN